MKNSRSLKPPAPRYAARRTTAPQATKPSTNGPGSHGGVGSGLRAISADTGSRRSSSPTWTRAATSPSRGWRAKWWTARSCAPGAHQESSSAKATMSFLAARAPTVRAADPRFVASCSTRTCGNAPLTAAAVPSEEPLSTTITSSGPLAVNRWRLSSRRCRRFRVATTTETCAGTGSPGVPVGPHSVPLARGRGSRRSMRQPCYR